MKPISKMMLAGLLFFAGMLPVYGQSSMSNASQNGPLMQAIEINEAEVMLGKLAAGKARDERVKSFAEMMVKDHTDALTKLHAIAGAPMDVKPSAKHQQLADRLGKLSGADFDRQYMLAMISGHEDALNFFEKQSGLAGGSASTSPLAKVSQDLIPAVRQHLQQAQQIQKNLKSK
jgi:putative membrane protein